MLLRLALLSFFALVLCGCVPVYVVSSELSDRYQANKEFFNDRYDSLKVDNVLFYVHGGYFNTRKEQLIIYFHYVSQHADRVFLRRAEIVTKDSLIINSINIRSGQKREEIIDGEKYIGNAAGLFFDISNIKKLLGGKPLVLKTYFKDGTGQENSINIPINITKEWAWPT